MKESKKRRQKQLAKSRSQPVNLPGAWPLMNPLANICLLLASVTYLYRLKRCLQVLSNTVWAKPVTGIFVLYKNCFGLHIT